MVNRRGGSRIQIIQAREPKFKFRNTIGVTFPLLDALHIRSTPNTLFMPALARGLDNGWDIHSNCSWNVNFVFPLEFTSTVTLENLKLELECRLNIFIQIALDRPYSK